MKLKKVPTRTCVGCHQAKQKSDLKRIVRTPQGEVILDLSGKADGRGVYSCAELACFNKAVKKKAFSRALGTDISPERLAELKEELRQAISRS